LNDPNAGSTAFHNYGIDWYTDRIEFFVDNYVYHIHYLNDGGIFQVDGQDGDTIMTIENNRVGVSEYSNHFNEWFPFEHNMYVILSAGVGGQDYTYGGSIVPEAEFPCSVFIDWVKVYELDGSLGINEIESKPNFNIFPNPAKDLLKIQIENPKEYSFKIIDISGKILVEDTLDQSTEIDVSHFKKGMYLVLVSNRKITMSKTVMLL